MVRKTDEEVEEEIKRLEEKIKKRSKKTTLECPDAASQIKNFELRIDAMLWTLGRPPKYNTA